MLVGGLKLVAHAFACVQLALTAATPIFRGLLADTDTRWDAISASVDSRTPAERGVGGTVPWQHLPHAANAAGGGMRRIPKSRCGAAAPSVACRAPR